MVPVVQYFDLGMGCGVGERQWCDSPFVCYG